MKHIKQFRIFESNFESWQELYNQWKEENKDRLIIKFPSGFVKNLEPHYALDLFKQDLESTGQWNPEWNQSHTEAWRDAQEQWATYYQRGI